MLYLFMAALAVLIVALDQVSKYLIVANLGEIGASVTVIPGIFNFTYVRNGNGMMGLFGEHRWVYVVFSIIIVAVIVLYIWKYRPKSRLMCASLAMILGGGIGNMIDRIFQTDGRVIDFIDFCAFPKIWSYIYNVADIFVCIGAGLLLLYLILDTVREVREERRAKTLAVQGTASEQETAIEKEPSENCSPAESAGHGNGDEAPETEAGWDKQDAGEGTPDGEHRDEGNQGSL